LSDPLKLRTLTGSNFFLGHQNLRPSKQHFL
jgi:hypothetical protein